jgi:hypothetical protein
MVWLDGGGILKKCENANDKSFCWGKVTIWATYGIEHVLCENHLRSLKNSFENSKKVRENFLAESKRRGITG